MVVRWTARREASIIQQQEVVASIFISTRRRGAQFSTFLCSLVFDPHAVIIPEKKLPSQAPGSSEVIDGRPVVAQRLLHAGLLSVLLGDGDEDHAHHQDHQADGHQGRSQDVGDLATVAGEVEAADDEAAQQEAAPGGHQVDGEPEDVASASRGLGGPQRLAAGQREDGALCPAGRGQLVPGLGQGTLPQGDVLWAAWHDLLDGPEEYNQITTKKVYNITIN